MPFLYVYSPSDFVGGLPDEQGAQAQGSGPFTLTLVPGATPTLIEVNDNDAVFDEVDGDQTLAGGVNIDGASYGAGTSIHSAYDLINSGSGHKVTSLHFGGNGYEQGAVHGLVSTEPLVAGQSYTFDRERTSHRQDNDYDDFVACFAAGSRIRTKRGDIAVQDLLPGDMIATADETYQPLRLRLSRHVSAQELESSPKLCPVRITAGSLGQGLPARDLVVSPQHRMLANGPLCERMFGQSDVLLSARKLTELLGIYVDTDVADVTYFHLVFDDHQVVYAEGAPSESFYCGAQAIDGLHSEARDELLTLFPELAQAEASPSMARLSPRSRGQRVLVQRLRKNDRTVLEAGI